MSARIVTGIDRLLDDPRPVAKKRIGFLGHPASVTADRVPSWHALAAETTTSLVRLFGPEHGLDGAAQDMEGVESGLDPATGLPVVSLYGSSEESLSPKPAQLEGLDAIVVDLVDVGARYYTFLATIGLLLRACARARVAVVVCDRPNPLGGALVEGPRLDPDVRSFVGMFDTPVVHGLTPGEFALWVAAREKLDVELRVVPMSGWTRGMTWPETGLPFVPPSPNMPTPDTALAYPGTCLVEATNLSEGRGTTRPFEQIGAPFVDGRALAAALSNRDLPGARFRPVVFKPTFQKWAGRGCGGSFLEVSDPSRFRPFRTGCALLVAASRAPGFEWRRDPYEFVSDRPAIDLLTGSGELRERIESGRDLEEWPASWERDEESWRNERESYLLYGDGESARRFASPPRNATLREASSPLPPMLAFVGRHDSGKTSLLVGVVERLTSRGFRVGTIKHTPHPVEMDRPGKDSRRHAEAGATVVALVTPDAVQLRETTTTPLALDEVVRRFFPPERVDLVLVEGYKTGELPKIEVVREAISKEPMCAGDPSLAAVVTDVPLEANVPTFPLGDAERVADFVMERLGISRS